MTENAAVVPTAFGPGEEADKKVYSCACHCGAVTFEARLGATPPAIRCNCSLCRKKNATMVRLHENDLRLLTGSTSLGCYEWNTGKAKHYFCKSCGIYTFHRMRSRPDHFGINASCIEGLEIDPLTIQMIDGARLD